MSIKRVVRSKEFSPETVSAIGIAIHSRIHVGILYRVSQTERVQILHLAWNRDLRSEPPSPEYRCWVRPEIGVDRAMAIAAMCRRVWKQNGRDQITYNFGSFKKYFNLDGNRIKGPANAGLTCASFVLAVFDAAKLPLIIDDEWPSPSREDMEVQNKYLENLKEDPDVTQDDINAYQSEMGNVRFRPLEVGGAGTADRFPSGYGFCTMMATEIESFVATC
jgi:hypothetical protein